MSKTRVAVLRGGPSEEYDVSLRTGGAVLKALNRNRFEPLDIIISKSGEWLHDGRTRYPETILPAVDVVFIALHGSYGEDGSLQRILDRYAIPYTGSKAYASGIAMHKALTKAHLRSLDILFPRHFFIEREEGKTGRQYAGEIRNQFNGEYIVKPIRSGSSVGITHVRDIMDLADAIDEALQNYEEIIVEEFIKGREFTCGVVERYRNRNIYALPPIEIIPPASQTYFSASVKYDGSTKEICPASIPHSMKKIIEDAASEIHTTLNLRQYSRSDFILGEKGLYFLEVNTLPGLTNESLFPKALHAVGATYEDFIHHLIEDALVTAS